MTAEVRAALQQMSGATGATLALLLHADAHGATVLSALGVDAVSAGDAWPASDRLLAADPGLALITDDACYAEFIPTEVRLALPAAVSGIAVYPVPGSASRLLLAWLAPSRPSPAQDLRRLPALDNLAVVAPLMDSQLQAHRSAARMASVVRALEQAVVILDHENGVAELNPKAAGLLRLPEGALPAAPAAAAMRALRMRSTDAKGLELQADSLLSDPAAEVRDWLWTFATPPTHLRVASAPLVGIDGRVWVFDDVSSEMQLVASEREARDRVAEAEARYRLLVENASDIVFHTIEGVVEWISPSIEAILGWTPQELVGATTAHLWHPEDQLRVVALRERVYEGQADRGVFRFRHKAGHHVWVEVALRPAGEREGQRGAVGLMHDVSDRVAAETAAAESGARLRLLAENACDVVFQGNLQAVVQWVSPSVREVLGREPADVIGHSVLELIDPRDLPTVLEASQRLNAGDRISYRARYRRADGEVRWCEVTARALRDDSGAIVSRVGSLRDVHEQVLAEDALARAEEQYRLVAENASDIVCRYDVNGIIDWAFGSTQEILGCAPAALIGRPALDVLVEEDLGRPEERRAVITSGETLRGFARVRRDDGTLHWVHHRTKAVFLTDGAMSHIITAWRDAEQEMQYRAALADSEQSSRLLAAQFELARNEALEANLAKTAFLSRMSHELRTPLNAVLGFAQLLAMDPLTPDQSDAVDHIRTAGRHLLHLINEILDISRIEAGRLSLSMESVGVGDAVGEALDLVRPLALHAGITIEAFDRAACGARVWADRQRFIQIVLNLLTNAVKYNRPEGSVSVVCEVLTDTMVAVRVQDTGIGIPSEHLARLFQPFDRLGAERSTVEGTGIGLTLSEGLARAMSGRLDVVTTQGQGSTFSLVLPSALTLPASGKAEPETVSPDATQAGCVLYIEDNPANIDLMRRILALRPAVSLSIATDGAQGLQAVRDQQPDLVFLDIHMPDMRGDEVLRRLRAAEPTAEVPVVIVTADASTVLREQMHALGAEAVLTKPVDINAVLHWVDSLTAKGGEQP